MNEPMYPALAALIEYAKEHLDRDYCKRYEIELADAERKAQQIITLSATGSCGKHQQWAYVGDEHGHLCCLLCSQAAEIERLRKQVKQAKIEGREEILKTYDRTIAVPLESWHAQRALLTRLAGALSMMIESKEQWNEAVWSIIGRQAANGIDLAHAKAALAEARAAGVVTE